eukprot:Rhum_TRINITY_DN8520_c0_g1::Rhum_TRINITY_DN8520_c0_g1_i1::g.28480::m.28480
MSAKASSAKAHASAGSEKKTQQESATADREQVLEGFEEAEMAAEALASGEWLLREEAGSGRPYYVHRATGSSVWDLREELARRARQEASVPVSEALAAGEWQVALDEETRSLYYFHPPTGTTCWELTEELVAANRTDAAAPADTSRRDEGEDGEEGREGAAADGAGEDKEAAAPAEAEEEAASPVSSLSASEGEGAEVDPLERPVFPEGLPGSERAAAVLDQGYWTWHVDEVGFRYYTEVASGRTVRDLRAEMAQVAAEERSAAVAMACEADELPEVDDGDYGNGDDDDAAASASGAGSPPAPASPPSSPKASAAEADRLLRSPIPVNSPEWDMPAANGDGDGDVPAVNDSLLLPAADDDAAAEPEAEAAAGAAGMPAAEVLDVGPPPPDFDGMFQEARAPAGDGADTYARAGVLRGVSGALQAAQDEAGRAPRAVRAVPRRGEGAYNARDKWGSVSYLDADTERQVELVREHELRRARVRTDLDEMRARYEATARQLLPLPPPPRVTAAAAAEAATPPRYRWDIGEARPFSPILPGSTVAMRLVNTPRPPTPLVLSTPQGMLSVEHLSV